MHASAKRRIARALAARGLEVRLEAALPGGDADRRADILVAGPGGHRVAIEIQHSPIDPRDLIARTRDYRALGLGVIWIPTLDVAALAPRRIGPGRLWTVPRFAAPGWHEWIAAQQSALWYWAGGALWRAWLEPLPSGEGLRREPSPDSDGAAARRLRALTLEGPFAPEAVRIQPNGPAPAPDTRHTLVQGPSAVLVAPGERQPRPCPTGLAFSHDSRGRLKSDVVPARRAA